MKSICGANCDECEFLKNNKCRGCQETNGCPFGKKCWVAKYIEVGSKENFESFKKELIEEINNLKIEGMKKVEELYTLNGSFVNLEYTLPNGIKVKYLHDDEIYLGNQIVSEYDDKTCFGIVANMSFILVCTYQENGINPELILYKKR